MIEDNFFSLQNGKVESQDNMYWPYLDLFEDEVEETEEYSFRLQRGRTVGYKDDRPNVLAAVTIERDLNLYKTQWKEQNSISVWFALLSGYAFGLYVVFYSLEYFCTFKSFQNYMASELYYIPEEVEKTAFDEEPERGCCESRPTDGLTRNRAMVSRDFHNEIIKEDGRILNSRTVYGWCKIFRVCCFCCKRRRIERIFKKARVYNAQELNITSIIKSQRESQAALEILRGKFGFYELEPVINS